ncbi:jg6456 [Pararge aegeria aegeria]|uniref:Jg6456 protein n=1 Tax=Pararge aegeria aegeria TaxID=348720 RepID=A0A8S4RUU2_9NEOP|nr:jg6456 [Pararge aegeria aegeria]
MDYLKHKRQKTLSSSLMAYEEKKTPPHQSSPRNVFSPPYEPEHVAEHAYQQWQMPALNIPGQMTYNQEMQWGQNYTTLPQLSPSMQSVPQNLPSMASNLQSMTNYLQQNTLQPIQSMSPNLQAMSPNMQSMSPNMQSMSPNMQAMSPNMQAMSPNMQAMSPSMQVMSPNMQAMSPNMQMSQMSPMGQVRSPVGISPNMGHVSPASMGHISPNRMQQQMTQQDLMEAAATSDTPSLTGLLLERGEGIQYSGEFSGLSSLLDARGPDLSDSLNRLSTSDLLH